jgi:hypothetical protein
MEAIKDGATKRINRSRRETGRLWQPCKAAGTQKARTSALPALRTVEEYNAKGRIP